MIKDQVEELIEESYLLSLSETEIRNYLRNFLESCEHVLSQMVGIHEDVKVVGVKIALLKVKLLLSEWSHYSVEARDVQTGEDPEISENNIVQLVRQVMDIKILITNLLDRVNPKLKDAVSAEYENRKQNGASGIQHLKRQDIIFNRKNLIGAGYGILMLITILILAVFIYV